MRRYDEPTKLVSFRLTELGKDLLDAATDAVKSADGTRSELIRCALYELLREYVADRAYEILAPGDDCQKIRDALEAFLGERKPMRGRTVRVG